MAFFYQHPMTLKIKDKKIMMTLKIKDEQIIWTKLYLMTIL